MSDNMQYQGPPVLVGERVAWLGSGSGLPQPATVRWIGRIPEITQGWTVGIELDQAMPVGGIDGTWRKRQLFSCEPKRGLLVPVDKVMKESSLLKTRHSLGESFYQVNSSSQKQRNQDLIRKLSLPQSASSQEFLAKVLPQRDSARIPFCDSDQALNFKKAALNLQNNVTTHASNDLNNPPLVANLSPAPLTIENVKAFDFEVRNRNEHRKKTLDELEKFKKHLDDWEKLKVESLRRTKRKTVGQNPESLYNLAQTSTDCEKSLFLRVVGEKITSDHNGKESNLTSNDISANHLKKYKSPTGKKKFSVTQNNIAEEQEDESVKDGDKAVVESVVNGHHNDVKPSLKIQDLGGDHTRSKAVQNQIQLTAQLAAEKIIVGCEETVSNFELDDVVWERVTERTEPEFCSEQVIVSPTTSTCEHESVSGPTPTIRKKRLPPVPAPRRRSSDGLRRDSASFEEDTAGVLYEPAFLKEFLRGEQAPAMSDVRGTFRRIDEDEIEKFPVYPSQPLRRPLTASISVPAPSRKGIFSFFKWFKKDKTKDDLDVDDLNAPSVAGSPLFTRARLGNATSVDTLYSIATVSSFAFVSGTQYQSAFGSDRKKKRKAPPPPEGKGRGDSSLPNSLDKRKKQQHRRSVSESYKDRRSGAFAHVQGKRKAPAPPLPVPQPDNIRLYPTLSSLSTDSLTRKKKPAPPPPPPENENPQEIVINESTEHSTVLCPADNDLTKLDVSNASKIPVSENIVCNDTLRLERGVLKPNKTTTNTSVVPQPANLTPNSPVSPRPWYKRKSLEKRKEICSEDWMPEIGFMRPVASPEPSPYKFHLFGKSDEKKKDDKRKSGLSWLANISELDREAAEICRKEQELQSKLLAANDAKFYSDSPPCPEADVPKRNSTRELITRFNSIGSGNPSGRSAEENLPSAVCDKPEIKTAAVVGTKPKCAAIVGQVIEVPSSPRTSKSQALFDRRERHHSPSPSVSTIAEISEPSSSATTLNQYAERIWTCTRCTLENLSWKNRCDACSACKPNYNHKNMARRKSEMELEIDWEKELEKYFPAKRSLGMGNHEKSAEPDACHSKDTESETKQKKDVMEKETLDPKEGDLDEIRKKRIAFFMKSLGSRSNQETSLRDAAAKKSLDESEKMKLKEMLKEMKNSLPKYEAAKNKGKNEIKHQKLPDVTLNLSSQLQLEKVDCNKSTEEAIKYGAIPKTRTEVKNSEALLVTTSTVYEDILVKKKQNKGKPADNTENGASLKRSRSGNGPYELMRVRDLENIIRVESKANPSSPCHIYANYPRPKESDSSNGESSSDSSGREVARLATQLTRASGVAEFRASLDGTAANTLAVNRLLRRLEAAIAAGRHDQAATLARELAGLKVNCSLIRQKSSPTPITLDMYVEDKVSHQGPLPLRVHSSMTVSDLKMKVQREQQIPCHVQRWILGKQLATEDFRTLEELGLTADGLPVFLYLVAPEPEPEINTDDATSVVEYAGIANEAQDKPPMGKGWYYNYEEDRYSFCESDSDNPSPERESKSNIINDTKDKVTLEKNKLVIDENKPVEKCVVDRAKPGDVKPREGRPKNQLNGPEMTENNIKLQVAQNKEGNCLKTAVKQIDSINHLKEKRPSPTADAPVKYLKKSISDAGSSAPSFEKKPESRPRSRSIFDLIKPQANDTLKKDLKVISVNAVKETIEKLTRRKEEGWRCDACTLVNESGRGSCGACLAQRPGTYVPPVPSPAEEELRRLRRDLAPDLPVLEPNENAHYLELVGLDNADLVVNTETFDCPVCMMPQEKGQGVVLRECLHTFCKACLAMTIEHSDEAEVKCPYRDENYACDSVLQQRETKALVPAEVFEQHLARGVAQAENRMGNAFHCKTPDCSGWCILDDNVNQFSCPVCSKVNCLTCHAIHQGMDCRAYQDRLKSSSDTNADARRTRTMLEEMVGRGDAMACPTCQVVLMKKWGCDWLRCSMCKTEICWVTRGPRWGPNGKGDTSAGCQCGINGVKCHPKCNYCH